MNARALPHFRATAILVALAATAALTPQSASAQTASNRPVIVGQIEHVTLPSPDRSGAPPVPARVSGDAPVQGAGLVSAGLTITPTFDTSITADPNAAAIENTINTAIAIVQSQLSDPITVQINFKEGPGLGASSAWFVSEPYSTFIAALKGDAKTADDATAVSLLPSAATEPVSGATSINVKLANLRAIGIATPQSPDGFDGTITLNTAITNPGSPGSSGAFNLLPVVLHEIDEVLGLGSALPSPPGGRIFPEDLYRYSAVNTRTFSATDSRTMGGVPAYFSIDAATFLAEFDNQNDGGDFGDWQSNPRRSGVAPKVQDAFATPGVNPSLSVELRALDVIGYDHGSRSRDARTDFDGDGKADVPVFRPSTGVWYVLQSHNGYTNVLWGAAGDVPVNADFDGDGKADIAVFRPSTNQWFILLSSTGNTQSESFVWGASGDIPVPRDFDGDGKADVAVFRPSTGQWFILLSSTGNTQSETFVWGANGDVPAPRDFDGDGKADVAVFRPSTGYWFILLSSTGNTQYLPVSWGTNGDVPVPRDYDGDGKADIAVFRPSTGQWFILLSGSGNTQYQAIAWGANGDTPVPADFDGDGRADVAVFRASTGVWYVLQSSAGYTNIVWGSSTDIPVPVR